MTRCSQAERGAASTELVLIAPVLLLLTLLVVAGGRMADGRAQVDAAARDAARAATLARTPAGARTDALAAARARLRAGSVTCRTLDVSTDTADFRSGGAVTSRVTCTVDLGDLTLLRVPATRTISSSASEPIDTYRAIS